MQLIVGADDFGRSASINQAVVLAFRHGVLTSASLMITGEAAGEAVALAKDTPGLAIGLHLVLADGMAAADPATIPHLADAAGRLSGHPVRAGLRYAVSPGARRELRREIDAQFARFERTGLRLAHIDGHHHLHLHPAVLPHLLRRAREARAAGFRVVREDLAGALYSSPGAVPGRLVWWAVYTLLGAWSRRRLPRGLRATARVYGLLDTGSLDDRRLRRILARLRGPDAEVYLHPDAARTGGYGSPAELSALLDPALPPLLAQRGVALTTYPGLGCG